MRIILATLEYPTEPYRAGGMCWAFAKIARGLKERGHDVVVAVPAERAGSVMDEAGIPVRRYEVRSHLPSRVEAALSWRLPISIGYYNHAWSLYRTLDELDGEADIDVVLAVAAPESFIAAGSRRWRYVCRVSAYRLLLVVSNMFPVTTGYLFEDWMKLKACTWADNRYAPSRMLADIFRRLGCGATEVVRTPMTPVATSPIRPTGLPARFWLFYGSLQGTKGAHLLAQAMTDVLAGQPDLHMVWIGRDLVAPEFGSMKRYVEQSLSGFPGRVHLPGVLEQEHALHYVAAAEWVLFPSVMDNLPNALLEAMYLERPVLVTRNSGTDDVVEDGRNGVVVDPNSLDALRCGLDRALAMLPAQREELGRQARMAVVAACDPDKAAAALDELLAKGVRTTPGMWWRRSIAPLRLLWLRLVWARQVFRFVRRGAPPRSVQAVRALCADYLPGCKLEFKP